ncbi:ABC transporter substrate-binding protein [Bacillus songklensis]|uniref:ABC transporter substrate-binding protein n=1 Tax=Bacillus songklensis TaxID=1069116 RepID=A0ABV8AZ73_9BACI
MLKHGRLLTLLIALMMFLAACGGAAESNTKQSETKQIGEKVVQDFPVTMKDARGKEVTLDSKPKKIVSLIPSNTEILFELGLNKQIIGVSNYDNYPEEALKKEKVGDTNVNVEKIVSLQPDIVFAHASAMGSSPDAFQQLEDAGVKVFVVKDATSFEQVYNSIITMGTLTGKQTEAEKIVKDMKADVAAIKEKANKIDEKDRKMVWVEVSGEPEIYTTGKGTFMDEMLNIIGAKNAAENEKGWVMMSEEKAVQLNPDVIITTYGYYDKEAAQKVLKRPAWQNVTAVKEKKVLDVNSDKVTRPGPRLAEGLQELAKAVYPEVYN